VKKICEFWDAPLSIEFKHVMQDMDIGESRADALRSMSIRINVAEVTSFIAIIIQAEEIGMSFSDVLHSQAKQMRILRQFRAKEIANSLPAKMIVPVVLFIFPALIAVIVAPLIPILLGLF
jgi:tight adherence protein C